jgi:hypothetical protein
MHWRSWVKSAFMPGTRLALGRRADQPYFGDAVTPAATMVDFPDVPPLLDFPAPRLRAYPRETVVAERLEAMVRCVSSQLRPFADSEAWRG